MSAEKKVIVWRKSVYDTTCCTFCGMQLINFDGQPINVRQGEGFGADRLFCRKCGLHVAMIRPYDGEEAPGGRGGRWHGGWNQKPGFKVKVEPFRPETCSSPIIIMMPMQKNVPEPKDRTWQLTTCPRCGQPCWDNPIGKSVLEDLEVETRSLCTECALKEGPKGE